MRFPLRRLQMLLGGSRWFLHRIGQGSDKRTRYLGGFSGASSGGRGNFCRGHPPKTFDLAL